jgi:uncharacterized phage protein gp47/JayE
MSEIRSYDDIMEQATASMIAQQDKLTDFNPGSIIHTFLDTVARLLERAYVAIRQGYNDNLRLVPYSLFNFTRKTGAAASGAAVFQRAKPSAVRTVIPKSTKISGAGKTFITAETGFIEPGNINSNPIPVIAENKGAEFNLPAYSIVTIESSLPSDVAAVVNQSPITGGTNDESDDEFDNRFKIYLNGLSGTNDYAILSAVLSLPAVRSASLENHKPPLKNIYNMSIYVDDGTGSVTAETLEAARLAVEGDGTAIHHGHLAPGVNIRVMPPLVVPVNYNSVIVHVYQADLKVAESEINTILAEYTNGLTISETVIISEAVFRIKKLPYVRDIKIPQENVELRSGQIARFGGANIEIAEIGNA